CQQPLEPPALRLLENPGIHQNESAPCQQQDAGGKKSALRPPQNPPQRLSGNHKPHLAPAALAGCDAPPSMKRDRARTESLPCPAAPAATRMLRKAPGRAALVERYPIVYWLRMSRAMRSQIATT